MTEANTINEEQPGDLKNGPEGDSQPHGTILLVDDNAATREAMCDMLEMLGHNVLPAIDGPEALEIFRRERVDLVLSDMIMPKMDGEVLYQALREVEPQVKMIILTGLPLGDRGERLAQAGIFALLKKPPDIDKVTKTVQQALQQSDSDD